MKAAETIASRSTEMSRQRYLKVVGFSGIDGAGKSTQIRKLCTFLTAAGFRVRLLAFWEDVSSVARLRESIGHAAVGGRRGGGSPAKPVKRRDKNVRSWYMTPARFLLYF